MRTTGAYRTVGTLAVVVLAGLSPDNLLKKKGDMAKAQERRCLIRGSPGGWTKRNWSNILVQVIKIWLDRRHGELGLSFDSSSYRAW